MMLARRFCEIIFLPLLIKGGTYPLPLDSVSPVEDSLSRCVAKIANEYFNRNLPTALFIPYRKYESQTYISNNSSHVEFLVQSLHQKIENSLVMLDYHNNPQSLHQKVKLGSYIIILSGDVSSYFDMAYTVIWKMIVVAGHMTPSGRLLIATTGSPNKERPLLIFQLFNMIWKALQISEAIVLLPGIGSVAAAGDVIEIYKWFPDEQDDPCLLFLNQFKMVDYWITEMNKFLYNFELFQINAITDMRECDFNISVKVFHPLTKVEGNKLGFGFMNYQLLILLQSLNLRMNVNPGNFNSVPNFNLPELLIFNGDEQFLTNDDCVAIYPYFIQNLKWIVPAGALVPRWKSLIKIFNPLMWLCVVTTFLIGSTTSWLLLKQNQNSLTFISALLDTLLTYVAAGINDRYKGTVASTFFLLWLFYCLILNTAYQSALISFLNNPGQEQPIRSLEELQESGLHLISKIMFPDAQTEEIRHINSNYEKCDDCYKMIAQNRNTALLVPEYHANYGVFKFYDSEINTSLVGIIDETFYTFYLTISSYTQGCLFFNRMEQLVHRTWSAGLIMRFIQDYKFQERKTRLDLFNKDPYVITLSHLQGGFFFLISGLFLSVTVFLIEIMYHAV
ncbi:Ionotropic receptor 489 [Blattella germanica]|nr:Ionotropic receptor 489 [Blattella germanica]